MAHINREDKADNLIDISIYALCSPIERIVYIWKTLPRNLRSTYKDHVNHHCKATDAMVTELEVHKLLPHMFLLEDVYTTHKLAYHHCVAWAKLFEDLGFEIIPMKHIQEYTDSLSPAQLKVFENIRFLSLDELCSPDKNLFPTYRTGEKRRDNNHQYADDRKFISIPVSVEQLQTIKSAAEASGKSQAAYCRERILSGSTIHIDFAAAMDIYSTILDCRDLLTQVIHAIYTSGSYSPADLSNLQALADTIMLSAEDIRISFLAGIQDIKQALKGDLQ